MVIVNAQTTPPHSLSLSPLQSLPHPLLILFVQLVYAAHPYSLLLPPPLLSSPTSLGHVCSMNLLWGWLLISKRYAADDEKGSSGAVQEQQQQQQLEKRNLQTTTASTHRQMKDDEDKRIARDQLDKWSNMSQLYLQCCTTAPAATARGGEGGSGYRETRTNN